MARPRIHTEDGARVKTSLTLPETLLQEIDDAAAEFHESRNAWILDAIRARLAEQKAPDEFSRQLAK